MKCASCDDTGRVLVREGITLRCMDCAPYSDEVTDLARELCAFTQLVTAARGPALRDALEYALAITQHTLKTVGLTSEEDALLLACTRLARQAINARFADTPDETTLTTVYDNASTILRKLP